MFDFFLNNNGQKIATFCGKLLNSKISPQVEAEKIVNKHYTGQKVFILIFPGLNYLKSSLLKRSCKVLSIFSCKEMMENAISDSDLSFCYPNHGLYKFLEKNIKEFEILNIKVLENPILTSIFPKEHKTVKQIVKDFINTSLRNLLTQSYFSKRWFLNSVKKQYFSFFTNIKTSGNAILASSGYSAEKILKQIQKSELPFLIFTLPSSISFLEQQNIKYDFIFSIDGGFYAKEHLLESTNKSLLFTNSFSAIPMQKMQNRDMSLCFQGSAVENYFFNKNDFLNSKSEYGSVFFFALENMLKIHSGKIFIVGQDFLIYDIYAHIRGHTSDQKIFANCNRLNSAYSTKFKSFLQDKDGYFENGYSFSKTLKWYYSWFCNEFKPSKEDCERVFFVEGPNLQTPFKRISYEEFITEAGEIPFCNVKKSDNKTNIKTSKIDFKRKIENLIETSNRDFLNEQSLESQVLKEIFSKEIISFLKSGNKGEIKLKIENFLNEVIVLNERII